MMKLLLLILTAAVVIEIIDLMVFRYPSELDIMTELLENFIQVAVVFVFVNGFVTGPLLKEIKRRVDAETELIHVNNHDVLTSLYNRTFYESELERLGKSRRYPVGIIIIDLDGLKMTNDTYGHAAGDKMIVKAAGVLQKSVRGDDMIARIGGDEFAILLPDMSADGMVETQNRIQTNLEQANAVNDGYILEMSLGSALAETKEKLLGSVRLADKNMYLEKSVKKGMSY